MKPGEFRYIIDESIGILWRRKTANIISTIIMALSLLILVTFLGVTLNIAGLIEKTSEEMRVYVYLRDDIAEDVSRGLQLRLMAEQGVEEVVFISKEEALEDFRSTLGEESDLLDALEDNPLPDAYRVKMKQTHINSETLEAMAVRVEEWTGIEEVRYGRKWFERGERLVKGFYIIDLVLGVIVFLSVVFVISNTVRLTILNSRKTIDILKLVGATNAYIQIPFIIEGALQGIVSSLLAIGLLAIIYRSAVNYLPGLVFIRVDAIAVFVFFCALLGAIGSFAGLRRFLRI
ncbi:MAG: ABC transporter permease [Bacteroidales bacterium]|nr:ABC transporter permease [Candidatus Latescibacterota bacterium]